MLLARHEGRRLYYFLDVSTSRSPCWLILPQYEVRGHFHPWGDEEKELINGWLASDGFRAFMHPHQRARFRDPLVDLEAGRLIIRSGKKKITPLL